MGFIIFILSIIAALMAWFWTHNVLLVLFTFVIAILLLPLVIEQVMAILPGGDQEGDAGAEPTCSCQS